MAILFFGGHIGYDANSRCDTRYREELARYAFCLCLIFTQFLFRAALTRYWTGFQLTKRSLSNGQTREGFIQMATNSLQAVVLYVVIGPLALYLSYSSASSIPASETIVAHAKISDAACTFTAQGSFLGTVYGGWALYQVIQLLMGWEKGGPMVYAHHAIFCSIGFLCPYVFVLYELTLFALTMENSGPFLEIMLVFREIEGHETLTSVGTVIFGVLFLLLRVGYFGYGLYRSLMFWQEPTTEVLDALGERVPFVIGIQIIYSLGYLVQLIWARTIVSKLFTTLAGHKIGIDEIDHTTSKLINTAGTKQE